MAYPGKIRIIGGRFKGRNIGVLNNPALRPTPSMVRETVFNWLQTKITQARCLDCFAGTGVLGFEALSRGASQVTLIESAFDMSDALKKTRAQFGITETDCQIIRQDTVQWLRHKTKTQDVEPYDIVFLDPPFHTELLVQCLEILENSPLLSPEAWIYVEMPSRMKLSQSAFVPFKSKIAGQVGYYLFEKA
jgi:16S rRNA (guanine966-N2)-methyltransferase